jgi:hypothetical protein
MRIRKMKKEVKTQEHPEAHTKITIIIPKRDS